ncbi:uncharacterized protein LOC126549419 [Aphis gossypii]|uniref:uncharacterized protein LOC126549419 n=1 Tax=Aphis gossypii TaxID=80765 RepID=UPI002159AE65|nr:uncharacterized protein LOC126549419 [Aphis gossypii]
MHFFQKVKTWSSALNSFIQRLLGILCLFILDNKHMTMIYISTNVWLLYVARLIAGSVIYFFKSSLLALRAVRREREPREVAVDATARTIEARLDALEEAIRQLSSQLAYFKQKQEPKNPTETIQSQQTPKINPSSSSYCYYHLQFGKEARKCGSNLCMFTPKRISQNYRLQKKIHLPVL